MTMGEARSTTGGTSEMVVATGLRRWAPWFVTGAAVLAFCGSLWIAYRSGGTAAPIGEAPLIKADPQPVKVRPTPEEARGEPDPQIYIKLAKSPSQPPSQPQAAAKLLPAPEKPMPRPVSAFVAEAPAPPPVALPQIADASPAAVAPPPVTAPRAPPEAVARVAGERERLDLAATKPQIRHTPPAKPGVVLSLPGATEAKAPEPKPAAPAVVPAVVSAVVPAAKPAGAAALAAVAPAAGGMLVQLGAYRSEAEAQGVWNRLKTEQPALVGDLKPRVLRADLGEKGVFFRLQVGPLADDTSARFFCRELEARKQACFLVRAG